jgi:hypothetical protein
MHVDEGKRREILALWRQGLSITMIAARVGVEYRSVKYAISLARKELGRETVPFAKDIPGKSTKGKTISFSKTTSSYVADDGLLTWAGAFKALARFARERGHDDVWQFAREIAQEKEMMTL